MSQCSIDGCTKSIRARGWCGAHYERWRQHGDPNVVQRRPRGLSLEGAFRWYQSGPIHGEGCIEWNGCLSADGYGRIYHAGKHFRAHVLAYRIFVGEIPDGMLVLHDPLVCNNRKCVNIDHLRLGTPLENSRDKALAGTLNYGEGHANSKLTDGDVVAIRKEYAKGNSFYYQLAEKYGVHPSTIGRAVLGRTWART